MAQTQVEKVLDFHSDCYRSAFSRINGIVIEGEQEAYDNFIALSQLLPDHAEELVQLAKMERRHSKSFEACGRNLEVTPDLAFAKQFFQALREAFQNAANQNQIATCLLIQALVIRPLAN